MLLALITAAVLSGSYLKNDLLDKNDALAMKMENAGAVWDVNENGIWGSPAGGSWKRSLIVIGGGNFSTVPWFLGQGYTVWVRRKPCTVPKCCRESLGYTTYLADDSLPEKPRRPFTTFVHGHLESWHQPDKFENLLDASVLCSAETGRFSSVSWMYQSTLPIWIADNDFIKKWKASSLQKVLPTPDAWNSYLGAQFTITAELLDSHSHEVYKMMYDATRADETKKCEIDSYNFEFAWCWIFGEDANITALSPSLYPAGKCVNAPKKIFVTEQSQWSSFGRKFHYNSEGIWSYPKCSGSCSRVMMVVGADPTLPSARKLLETLLSAPETRDYGIWLRQPTYQCPYGGVNIEINSGTPCSFTEGYSRFMHRYGVDDINAVPSKDRDLKADIFVFLSGLEEELPINVMKAAEASAKRDGYFPVGSNPVGYCPAVIGRWPEPSGLNVPVQGFETNSFAVPSDSVYNINAKRMGFVREFTTYLIVIRPDFFMAYWHFILGSDAKLTRSTIKMNDPLFPLINCVETKSIMQIDKYVTKPTLSGPSFVLLRAKLHLSNYSTSSESKLSLLIACSVFVVSVSLFIIKRRKRVVRSLPT